mgnify:CR=1 FL=1
MVNIEVGKELILENVLSLRKKLTQEEINSEIANIKKYFELNGIGKAGPIVTSTHSVEMERGVAILDMEIIIPMDRNFADVTKSDYKIKPVFKIANAIYVRNQGNPSQLEQIYKEMMSYIQKNGLQQITPSYNVTVKEILPGMDLNEAIIDVYIGINPNIL